jgi:hypothetical protein
MRKYRVAFLFGCLLFGFFLGPVCAREAPEHDLATVFAGLKEALAAKKTPVMVFDLDGTLFDTAQRNVRILQEWAVENASNTDAEAVLKMSVEDAAYGIADTLKNRGVTNAETVASVESFWLKRFFTNEYVVIDEPIPGGAKFVKECQTKGAVIVYLTGRDVPRMGKGTEESLRKHGFPVDGENVLLMLKPRPEAKDMEFKQEASGKIRQLGEVVAIFENQPRNLNALLREFPTAIPVFIETNFDLKDQETPPTNAIKVKKY